MWNCRGVAKKGMSTFVKTLLWEHHADFVGFQETIKSKYPMSFFLEKLILNRFLSGGGFHPEVDLDEFCLDLKKRGSTFSPLMWVLILLQLKFLTKK